MDLHAFASALTRSFEPATSTWPFHPSPMSTFWYRFSFAIRQFKYIEVGMDRLSLSRHRYMKDKMRHPVVVTTVTERDLTYFILFKPYKWHSLDRGEERRPAILAIVAIVKTSSIR
jgi:hypothetical protein